MGEKHSLKAIEYERQLDLDARLRVEYSTSRKQVTQFVVQLEVFAGEQWQPVVRYDSAHRFAHRDLYFPNGKVTKTALRMSFEEALSFALQDLRDNWETYRERFLKK